jgi:hypothetical protein
MTSRPIVVVEIDQPAPAWWDGLCHSCGGKPATLRKPCSSEDPIVPLLCEQCLVELREIGSILEVGR